VELLFDGLVVVLLLAVLGLPVAATAAVAHAGVTPTTAEWQPPPAAPTPAAGLRELPIFTPGGDVERAVTDGAVLAHEPALREALEAAARRAFGGADTAEFWDVLALPDLEFHAQSDIVDGGQVVPYPYRYPHLDPVLDRLLPARLSADQADAVNDLAALLIVGTGSFGVDENPSLENAGAAAFALMNRSRAAAPSCAHQLNLAFLLAADQYTADDVIDREFDGAIGACPQDPTPLWLLGEFRVQQTYVMPGATRSPLVPPSAQVLARPIEVFHRLQGAFPGSALGWAGEADASLSLAEDATDAGIEPFTARHRFDRALALYQRAGRLSDDPGIDIGIARALAGLRRFDEAAEAAQRAIHAAPGVAAFQLRRTEYLERGGRFADAAAMVEPLLTSAAHGPSRRNLMPNATFMDDPLLSIGVGSRLPVSLSVGQPSQFGAGASAYDFSFIPDYRQDALTGYDPACREWSLARDLILAGRPGDAAASIGQHGDPTLGEPQVSCARVGGDDRTEHIAPTESFARRGWLALAAVADAEAGSTAHAGEALARLGFPSPFDTDDPDPIAESRDIWRSYIFDKRQNMWRFAGNLDRAKSIVDEWLAQVPGDPSAADRAGEIAFLRGDHAAAAAWFAKSAAAFSPTTARGALARATALLKQGAAEGQAGRDADAKAILSTVPAAGESAGVLLKEAGPLAAARFKAGLIVYYARVQLGDAALRTHDYADAVADYSAAIDMYPDFENIVATPPLPSPLKNGAAENNAALAHILLGSGDRAIETATAAVGRDPQSPVFLQTLAYAYQSAGRLDAAVNTYRQALEFDETLFPAANDLGVILAKQHRADEALTALRHAVGVNPDYALGWFNLGVHLSAMGPRHYLEAQGALGRAARLDSALRDRDRELTYDAEPYYSGLDLSRPLPPEWRFVATERRVPAALTVLIVLLLLGRLVWGLGLDQVSGKVAERLFGWTRRAGWLGFVTRPVWPVVAVLATVALFLWPWWRSPTPAPVDAAVLAVGVLALLGAYLRSRSAAARRAGASLRHFTWLPAVGFGAALTAAGLGFAPVPAAETSVEHRAVRWAGPLALASVTVVLLALGWWSGTPATRALGASGVVMMSSVLLPTKPFDGAFITHRLANTLIFLAMLGVATVLLLGWI
jgi:tetratricopeptide (TPR) repeat protein